MHCLCVEWKNKGIAHKNIFLKSKNYPNNINDIEQVFEMRFDPFFTAGFNAAI
jgi:hypothetical protein